MSESTNAASIWRPLRGTDPRRLSEGRLQTHYAVQWLARVARAYVTPLPDDAHTNLGWNDACDGFVTHPFQGRTQLCLNVADLTLALLDGHDEQQFPLDRRTNMQVRQWLGERLGAVGLVVDALDAPSPYEMPAHALAEGACYDAAGLSDALAELATWFANAESLLVPIQRQMKESRLDASDVRCWPHHFDLAALISFPARDGQTGYVGVGLSPGDSYYDEPYFYISVYPRPDTTVLPPLPRLGHWHTHEFTAAVVPAHKILAARSPQAEIVDFLQSAVDRAIKILR
jgi:hypothetical protein